MYLTLIFIPLISAILCGFFGFFIGSSGSCFLSCFFIFFVFIFSWISFFSVGFQGINIYIDFIPWIKSSILIVNWGFLFDSLTVTILVIVSTVSFLVHIYSVNYIENDPHRSRFIAYLSFFTFFIFILVSADNFVQIFVGWEGVGLCSFLLINFWFTRIQANKAAIKAILVNRVGDFGLVIGIAIIFYEFNCLDYSSVFSLTPLNVNNKIIIFGNSFYVIDSICFFLFIGAIGKSAQLGLHTWLPDAIEGPTPVSALIHAATIVTAGVFIIVRCSPLFEYSPSVLNFITILGAMTAFTAASIGLFQNDLKKVIAYSTCSQLGYIIFSCGVSIYPVSIFHLYNHAFFKALLFLSAGSVIHAIADEQDIRKIGGLIRLLPLTYSVITVASLALIGFPFLSGFYSKDCILEVAYANYSTFGYIAFFLGTVAASFTAFYSFRLIILTFIGYPKGFKKTINYIHEGNIFITFPLVVLLFFSIYIGFFSKEAFIGIGCDFFENSIFIYPSNYKMIEAEFIPTDVKITPLIFSIIGASASFFGYIFFFKSMYIFKLTGNGIWLYSFFNKKWFFDKIYNEYFNQSFIEYSHHIVYKIQDKGIIEIFGPFGVSSLFYKVSRKIAFIQTGNIYHYNFFISFFCIVSIFFIVFLINLQLKLLGCVAQLVEQKSFKLFVVSSNLTTPKSIFML